MWHEQRLSHGLSIADSREERLRRPEYFLEGLAYTKESECFGDCNRGPGAPGGCPRQTERRIIGSSLKSCSSNRSRTAPQAAARWGPPRREGQAVAAEPTAGAGRGEEAREARGASPTPRRRTQPSSQGRLGVVHA